MEISNLKDFWALVIDVWKHGVYGIDIIGIIIALVIFCLFLLLRNLITRFIVTVCARAVDRTQMRLDDRIIQSLTGPIRFIPVVMGVFFATSVLDVSERLEAFFGNINRSLVAITIFWALYQTAEPIGHLLYRARGILTEAMIQWLVKIVKIVFVALGAATILEMWGIAVAPILAGLGLFGVAVAFGAQSLFKNLIAGFFVIGERRLLPGDWVKVDNVVEGTVEDIGFRTTKIRRFDKAAVYVPNAELSDNAITNFSRMTYRRIYWLIGVEYRTTIDQLREIRDAIEAYVYENDEFADPSEVSTFVRIDAFSDSSIDIMLYCFTRTREWGEWLEIKERLAYKVKEIVEAAGTSFAFPARSLYLQTLPDAPDLFPFSSQQPTAAVSAAGGAESAQKS